MKAYKKERGGGGGGRGGERGVALGSFFCHCARVTIVVRLNLTEVTTPDTIKGDGASPWPYSQ